MILKIVHGDETNGARRMNYLRMFSVPSLRVVLFFVVTRRSLKLSTRRTSFCVPRRPSELKVRILIALSSCYRPSPFYSRDTLTVREGGWEEVGVAELELSTFTIVWKSGFLFDSLTLIVYVDFLLFLNSQPENNLDTHIACLAYTYVRTYIWKWLTVLS